MAKTREEAAPTTLKRYALLSGHKKRDRERTTGLMAGTDEASFESLTGCTEADLYHLTVPRGANRDTALAVQSDISDIFLYNGYANGKESKKTVLLS